MPAPKNKYLMMSLVLALLLSLVAYLLLRTAPITDPIPAQTAIAPSKPLPAIPTPKPERPNVQRILFAGDSMMQGIAPIIMRQLKASHPEWLLRNESQQSTGLTVKRRLDWVQKIKTEIVEHKLEGPKEWRKRGIYTGRNEGINEVREGGMERGKVGRS